MLLPFLTEKVQKIFANFEVEIPTHIDEANHFNLLKQTQNVTKGEISNKFVEFSKNDSLAKISKRMNLREYLANEQKGKDSKFDADLFEAFIGALYLDAGQNGLDKAYEFLYENFSNIICPIEI